MKRSEQAWLAAAVLCTLFGLFMMLGAIVLIADPKSKDSVTGDSALFVLLGILPVLVGVWLFRRTRARVARRAIEAREQTVLHLASQHDGALTVPQLAEQSGMSLDEAKEVLDRLYRKHFNEVSLSDSGELVYRFQL